MAKVHRAYRHSWWRKSKELNERDYQAMCNFAESTPLAGCDGITVTIRLDVIAEHFGCSVVHVREEIVLTEDYGYRRRAKQDEHESVKLNTAKQRQWLREVLVKMEETRHAMTWQEYLDTVDWQEAYRRYGDDAVEVVKEKAQEIAARSNLDLIFA